VKIEHFPLFCFSINLVVQSQSVLTFPSGSFSESLCLIPFSRVYFPSEVWDDVAGRVGFKISQRFHWTSFPLQTQSGNQSEPTALPRAPLTSSASECTVVSGGTAQGPWWSVRLDEPFFVHDVTIVNSMQTSLVDILVEEDVYCVRGAELKPGERKSFACHTTGRSVKIQSPPGNDLSFCGFELRGHRGTRVKKCIWKKHDVEKSP